MNRSEKLAELRSLQARCNSIRQELEICQPGEVIYLAPLDVCPGDTVVVEADGFGGATTRVIEGSYPLDYVTKHEKFYPDEGVATETAEALDLKSANPSHLLGALA